MTSHAERKTSTWFTWCNSAFLALFFFWFAWFSPFFFSFTIDQADPNKHTRRSMFIYRHSLGLAGLMEQHAVATSTNHNIQLRFCSISIQTKLFLLEWNFFSTLIQWWCYSKILNASFDSTEKSHSTSTNAFVIIVLSGQSCLFYSFSTFST